MYMGGLGYAGFESTIIVVVPAGKNRPCFLSEEDSEDYVKVFKAVRLQHILNDKPSLSTIEADKIIPESKLRSVHCI